MTYSVPLDAGCLPFFRPLRNSDRDALFGLIGGCFQEYAAKGVVLDPQGLDHDLQAYASYIEKEQGEAYGLFAGSLCLASMAYGLLRQPDQQQIAEIKRFYMVREGRGGGLAVAMLADLERRVMAKGVDRMILWSDTRFTRAHRFYEREGYRKTGKKRALNDLSRSIEYLFDKKLYAC